MKTLDDTIRLKYTAVIRDKNEHEIKLLTCLIATSPIFGENFRMFSKKSLRSDMEASFMFSLSLQKKILINQIHGIALRIQQLLSYSKISLYFTEPKGSI